MERLVGVWGRAQRYLSKWGKRSNRGYCGTRLEGVRVEMGVYCGTWPEGKRGNEHALQKLKINKKCLFVVFKGTSELKRYNSQKDQKRKVVEKAHWKSRN